MYNTKARKLNIGYYKINGLKSVAQLTNNNIRLCSESALLADMKPHFD